MRSYVVHFLPFLILISEVFCDFPQLERPANLTIAGDSDTTAVVRWDFVEPKNVSLSKIEFVLKIESTDHWRRKVHRFFTRRPFKTSLTGLSPSRKYTVRVSAKSPNWRQSPPAETVYVSISTDWPTPEITEILSDPREELVVYTAKWTSGPPRHSLQYHEVEICLEQCFKIKKGSMENQISFPVKYKSTFTVSVTSVFDVPDVGEIRRTSEKHGGKTGTGAVARILRTMKAEQEDNKVKLAWLPTFPKGGPIPYYEFFVCDPNLANDSVSTEPPTTTETLPALKSTRSQHLPELDGEIFRMDLESDEEKTTALLPESLRRGRCLARRPPFFTVVKKIRNAARFRIYFRDSYIEEETPDPEWHSRHLRLGPGVAEAFGFSHYTRLFVKIRSCLVYATKAVDTCGNFSDFEILSNVAGPSRVRSLRWTLRDTDDALEVSWEEPEDIRGPLNGFKVSVQQMCQGQPCGKETVHWLKPNMLSFVSHEYDPQSTYKIGVAAYNLDIEEDSEWVVGDWDYIVIAPKDNTLLWIAIVVIMAITTIAVASCIIIRTIRIKRRAERARRTRYEDTQPLDRQDRDSSDLSMLNFRLQQLLHIAESEHLYEVPLELDENELLNMLPWSGADRNEQANEESNLDDVPPPLPFR